MRLGLVWCLGVSVGCGPTSEECETGVELGEADAGCDCAGDAFELFDNGAICTCGDEGLSCDTATNSTTSSGGCRRAVGVDCG
jgi:hypothetical protein